MGRIRTIKPEFFTHEELSALPEITHLFAAGLLCYADDDGYFNANEGLIKANVFPLRESSVSIHDMLNQLVELGYVRLGCNGTARRYGRIVNFDIHQRVNRPTPSKIKGLEIEWENSVNPHTQLSESSSEEGKGREGNREEEGNRKLPPSLERFVKADSVDVRCLSETVGIFGMREQSDMLRLLTVHMKDLGLSVAKAIDAMIGRWKEYQAAAPMLEWQYGSSYKFFMSGNWNRPEMWPKIGAKPTAKEMAFKAFEERTRGEDETE